MEIIEPYLKWMNYGNKRFVANLKKDNFIGSINDMKIFKHIIKNKIEVYYSLDKYGEIKELN